MVVFRREVPSDEADEERPEDPDDSRDDADDWSDPLRELLVFISRDRRTLAVVSLAGGAWLPGPCSDSATRHRVWRGHTTTAWQRVRGFPGVTLPAASATDRR